MYGKFHGVTDHYTSYMKSELILLSGYKTKRKILFRIERAILGTESGFNNANIMSHDSCGIHYNPEKHGKVISLSSVRQKKEILDGPYDDYSKSQSLFKQELNQHFFQQYFKRADLDFLLIQAPDLK